MKSSTSPVNRQAVRAIVQQKSNYSSLLTFLATTPCVAASEQTSFPIRTPLHQPSVLPSGIKRAYSVPFKPASQEVVIAEQPILSQTSVQFPPIVALMRDRSANSHVAAQMKEASAMSKRRCPVKKAAADLTPSSATPKKVRFSRQAFFI